MVKALFRIQNSPCEVTSQSLVFQTQFNFLSLRREIEENKGKMSDQNQQPIPGCNILWHGEFFATVPVSIGRVKSACAVPAITACARRMIPPIG